MTLDLASGHGVDRLDKRLQNLFIRATRSGARPRICVGCVTWSVQVPHFSGLGYQQGNGKGFAGTIAGTLFAPFL